MATYKVIQDIEAEDKFLGPLTLKQFIFAMAGILFGYLNFFAISRGATWAMAIFSPPMFLAFFLAVPWSKEQSTEIWVLAKLQFRLKPKRRIWDQDGMQELVTITAPKKIEHPLTNNLGENEVNSRLKVLAETIDSRGWAVKHSTMATAHQNQMSDRLVEPAILPQQVPEFDGNVVDMLDTGNPIAANFTQMIQTSSESRREQNLDNMDRVRRGQASGPVGQDNIRFIPPPPPQSQQPIQQMNSPVHPVQQSGATSFLPPINESTDDKSISQQLKQRQASSNIAFSHMRNIGSQPAVPQNPIPTANADKPQAEMTSHPTPAIMSFAQNDDLSVETIARQAKKTTQQNNNDEVVVSLR